MPARRRCAACPRAGGVPHARALAARTRAADPPHHPISHWRDTVFFCGMTLVDDTWYCYYGGSEYYTCLATAPGGGRS